MWYLIVKVLSGRNEVGVDLGRLCSTTAFETGLFCTGRLLAGSYVLTSGAFPTSKEFQLLEIPQAGSTDGTNEASSRQL